MMMAESSEKCIDNMLVAYETIIALDQALATFVADDVYSVGRERIIKMAKTKAQERYHQTKVVLLESLNGGSKDD